MERLAAAGALLVGLLVVGTSSAVDAELSGEQEGREGKWWEGGNGGVWREKGEVGPSN